MITDFDTKLQDFPKLNIRQLTFPIESVSNEINSLLAQQVNIFNELERDLILSDARSLGNRVHFQNSPNTPVQRWFPYREGYSVDLVNKFIDELKIQGSVFDPFSGSGTTLLSSRLKSIPSIGIDVNPISVMVARAENEQYGDKDVVEFTAYYNELLRLERDSKKYSTNFDLANKVFNEEILQSLLQIREFIKRISNEKVGRLFFITWLAIIEGVSNVKKEGNGIKYKNRKRTPSGYINIDKEEWEKSVFPDDKFEFVKKKLTTKLIEIKDDIVFNFGPSSEKPQIYHGDCLEFDQLFNEEIELTFFSPPYCNCFDYFEIHKVELWLGEFVTTKEEMKELRNGGFRSNTNSIKDKEIVYRNNSLEMLINLFDNDKLWSKRIPDVVRGYFDDMHTLLNKLFIRTNTGGYVSIVVGNSAYTGVIIPTDILIANIAREVGFIVENIFVTRHLTTSSQQKQKLEHLKDYLRESVILLRKE